VEDGRKHFVAGVALFLGLACVVLFVLARASPAVLQDQLWPAPQLLAGGLGPELPLPLDAVAEPAQAETSVNCRPARVLSSISLGRQLACRSTGKMMEPTDSSVTAGTSRSLQPLKDLPPDASKTATARKSSTTLTDCSEGDASHVHRVLVMP